MPKDTDIYKHYIKHPVSKFVRDSGARRWRASCPRPHRRYPLERTIRPGFGRRCSPHRSAPRAERRTG
uniref:Uncharacterized protein n=1 Tax=Musa acuminata subsp. malaccensis TaxID=214687 RepID=A0A804HNI5_MUSAM